MPYLNKDGGQNADLGRDSVGVVPRNVEALAQVYRPLPPQMCTIRAKIDTFDVRRSAYLGEGRSLNRFRVKCLIRCSSCVAVEGDRCPVRANAPSDFHGISS
jgi:hypothetical protein